MSSGVVYCVNDLASFYHWQWENHGNITMCRHICTRLHNLSFVSNFLIILYRHISLCLYYSIIIAQGLSCSIFTDSGKTLAMCDVYNPHVVSTPHGWVRYLFNYLIFYAYLLKSSYSFSWACFAFISFQQTSLKWFRSSPRFITFNIIFLNISASPTCIPTGITW